MKKEKAFDCVQMKRDIQRRQAKELAGVPEAEQRDILMERVRKNPILSPFLPSQISARPP